MSSVTRWTRCTTLTLEDFQPVTASETCHSLESQFRLHLLRSHTSSVGDAQAHDRAIDITTGQPAPNAEATVGSLVLVMSMAWGP